MACTSSYILCACAPKSSKSQGGPPFPTRPSWERLVYYITHKEIGTEPAAKRKAAATKVSLGAVTQIRSCLTTNLKSWCPKKTSLLPHSREVRSSKLYSQLRFPAFRLAASAWFTHFPAWNCAAGDKILPTRPTESLWLPPLCLTCTCTCRRMHVSGHWRSEKRKLFIISAAEASRMLFEPSKNTYAVCLQGFSNISLKKTHRHVQGSSGPGLSEQQQKREANFVLNYGRKILSCLSDLHQKKWNPL